MDQKTAQLLHQGGRIARRDRRVHFDSIAGGDHQSLGGQTQRSNAGRRGREVRLGKGHSFPNLNRSGLVTETYGNERHQELGLGTRLCIPDRRYMPQKVSMSTAKPRTEPQASRRPR